MSEYQPGTVAVATVRGVPGVRVMYVGAGMWRSVDSLARGDQITDVRPLVVLDLDEVFRDPLETPKPLRLATFLREITSWTGRRQAGGDAHLERLADQIEAQTKPPKIPEPIALGAVVEDAQGQRWVRASTFTTVRHWRGCDDSTQGRERWENIDAVRVLSEGVQP